MPRPTDWNAIGLDGDPTPGDPERIRTLATELNGLGTSAREISTAIDAVMNTAGDSVFVGEAANALRDKVDDRLRGHIEDVAQSFESAATALTGWADKLTELQQTADGALSAGRGLSEDDSQRETYATTARQAGTDHSEAASTAAGTIRGVANIQLPISQCEIFWEAFQWLAIILIIPALIFGGPIALLAIGVNLTLFLKTVVDFARGDANFLDLFLAGLGILAPTTKALPIFQIIKAGATAFGKGFANVARSAFQGLRNLFTNGFRFTSLMPGIQDFLRLSTTWVRQNGLWVMQGLHNLPQLTGMAFQRGGLTVLQNLRAIPGVVRGLPSTLGRGFTAGANGLGRAIVTGWNGLATGARATWNFAVAQLGGSKWLRLILPVDAGEIGQYGLRGALRIGLFERGVMGSHIFGAPLGGAVGRGVSAVQVPIGPHGVDALVDMPRVQLNNVRLGDWAGSNVGTRPFQMTNGPVDLSSALRTPDLHLGNVGALGDRTGLGLHASRQLDALVDIPKAHLNAMHLDGFGTMPGRADTGLGVSATGSAPTLHSSGLYLPASAGAPTSHGVNLTAAGPVPGGTHATLTAVQAPAPGTAATADVLLSGGPGGTHTAPATTVLTGAHTPPPGTTATGNLLTPGTPGPGPAHTVLSGTQTPPPGVTGAHDLTMSSAGTQGAHNLTVTPGTTAGATPPATGAAIGTGTHVTPGGGVSAFDLLAGGGRGVPDSPVPAGAGNTLADRTTSALTANQTRLHLDELVHAPGSPRPGGTPTPGVPGSAVPTPGDPARGTAGGAVPPPEHTRAALDLVGNGPGVRSTDSPAFAGAPGRTDAGAVHGTPVSGTGDAGRGTPGPVGGASDGVAHAFAGTPVRRNTPVTAAQHHPLTPTQIEQLWIRDGERVDALFGAADDPLRQARREAWRDFARTRHDLGRAEDLVRGGDAGTSSGPSVHEIRIRQDVEGARGRHDAAHRRLTDLGVDPARMDADFTALYTRSLSERPRVVAGMLDPGTPHGAGAHDPGTPHGAGAHDPGTPHGAGAHDPGIPHGAGPHDPGTPHGAGTHDPATPQGTGQAVPPEPLPAIDGRNVVGVPGRDGLVVQAPRGEQPRLLGTGADSGTFTVDAVNARKFVVHQLDGAGGSVVRSWTFQRMGMSLRLADEGMVLSGGPFHGSMIKITDKTAGDVTLDGANWPAKLGEGDEIAVASPGGNQIYSRSTGELLRTSVPGFAPPVRPAHLVGEQAARWDAAADLARTHLGRAETDNGLKLFMQGVIGGAFTSKKGYGGFLNPSALDANPGLVGKVEEFNKITKGLLHEGRNEPVTVWRGVSMDPHAAQADVFVERLPASTSNNRDFQAEWAKNGVKSNRVVFEIDVPADHGKLAMAYPPGYTKTADDVTALNQDQWEITLSPTNLVRTGPSRIEDGVTVIPVRAEQIPPGQLAGLITEKWSGLPSGTAFDDFGRAFGQDSVRRWEGFGDALVRETGGDPLARTFVVSRPGFADELTVTVTHKPADNAVSVSFSGHGVPSFSKEWSGAGFSNLAADLRGGVLHNNDLFSPLPAPASWREAPTNPADTPGTAAPHTESPAPHTDAPAPHTGSPDTHPGRTADTHGGGTIDAHGGGSVDTHAGGIIDTHPGRTVDTHGGGTIDTHAGGTVDTRAPRTGSGSPDTATSHTGSPGTTTPHTGSTGARPGQSTRLTPAEIEQLWIRDGERVDALFGAADDPLRQARREAWRDFARTRHDLGRAEDLVRGGDAGSSSGPSVHEIRIRQDVEGARGRHDAAHRRLTDLGVDPARMDADFTALYTRSLSERPRVIAGMYQETPASPHPAATTSDATPPPVAHTVDDATTSTAQPQRLNEVLDDHSKAVRDLQRIEASQSQVGKSTQARNEAQIELEGATRRVDETRAALDDALTRQVSAGELSQRELNMLVDQFAGAGDIERAAVLREHAVALDVRARGLPSGAGSRPDQIIRTGTEIRDQALTVQNRALELERALATGTATPEELKLLSGDLTRSVDDLEAGLQGFVRDAAPLGGAYALRNEFGPVASVGRYLAKLVDDAVEKAGPGAQVAVKGFLGTETSVARVRPLGEFVRRFRTDKAYAEVPTGQQWKSVLPGDEGRWTTVFEDFGKLSPKQQVSFVRTLSEENVKALRREVDTLLDGMSPTDRMAFRALRERLENLPYRIKHATPAYHAIANSGIMSSQGDLARRGAKFLASGKSSAKNTSNLGNDDFVFFRMEVGDKAMESRYGPTTLVFDAKVLEEKGGWVSLHDQLHPLDRETMRHLTWGEDLARGAKYDAGFDEVGKRARWTYQYPDGSSRPVSFEQEVFHGEHVREALALSVVREVASIGGDFQTHVLKLLDNLDNTDALGSVVSKLYRPEAKFASGLPINPSGIATHADLPTPLQVVNKDGDGRYLADGTVDPAARAAGKKYDEAADRVRQADNAIASQQTKSVGYHLRKAELHAQQSVDLTRTFHASATGERQVLAQSLLDQRVKLLEEIQNRLRPQPKPQPVTQVEQAGSAVTAGAGPLEVKKLVGLKDHPVDHALAEVLTDASAQAKKMARVLAESGGFRPLANSTDGAQTTAAVGLGRSAFDKAFKALRGADLVVGMDDGLHLTEKGRTALLPQQAAPDLSVAPSTSGGGPDIPAPRAGGSGLQHGPASGADLHGASAVTDDVTRIGGDLGPIRLDAEGSLPGLRAGQDDLTTGGTGSGGLPPRDLDLPHSSRGHGLPGDDVPPPAPAETGRTGTDDGLRLSDEPVTDPVRVDRPTPGLNGGTTPHPSPAAHPADTFGPAPSPKLADDFLSPPAPKPTDTLQPPSGLRGDDVLPPASGLRGDDVLAPPPGLHDGDGLLPSSSGLRGDDVLPPASGLRGDDVLAPPPGLRDGDLLRSSAGLRGDDLLPPSPGLRDGDALHPAPASKAADTLPPSPGPHVDDVVQPSPAPRDGDITRPAPGPDRSAGANGANGANGLGGAGGSHTGGIPRPPVGPHTGGAGPVAADLLDPAVFRRNTSTATGVRSQSQIDVLDRALAAFHRIPETQLAQRAQALDQLAAAADNFLHIRPQSARRAGVQRFLNQTRAEATAYRLLDEYDNLGAGQGARAQTLDDLASRTRTALTAGGAHQGTHTRLQNLLTRVEREADAFRLIGGGSPRTAPTTTSASDLPWAREYAGAEAVLGPEGRPFREAWAELTRTRQELGRVENLRALPATGSTSQPISAVDAQFAQELATAQGDFRTAYQNLRDLGIEPRDIDARLSALNHDAAVDRGARVGAGFLPQLPDSVPASVATLQLSNSGVAGPNGLTIERITAEDGSVTHRMVDHQSHLDDSRTVTPRPDGGFDVRHTPTDTLTVYNAGGSRIADDIPLRGAGGQPNGLRLHTDLNGHGRPQESRVPGPDADRYSVVRLPDDTTRITDLRTGVSTRFGAQGDHLDQGLHLTGRDGAPAAADRILVTEGAGHHVTDLAGTRLPHRVTDLGAGNGFRVTDDVTGASVRHDNLGHLRESDLSLTDAHGTRGGLYLAHDGAGAHTVTDALGTPRPGAVTVLPDGGGFRVIDDTTGATTRYAPDGHWQDAGRALADPATGLRGARVAVPDGSGGHRLTDLSGTPLPERVVDAGNGRLRTVDDVSGQSVLHDADARPVSTSTALADPVTGQRGARFAEPDGSGGHRLTDPHGAPLPDAVTALPGNGGFRTAHPAGHTTFAADGAVTGDGLRLTGRHGGPGGHLDRPRGAAARWLDDAFTPDPSRPVTVNQTGHIEIGAPGGGHQLFDGTTGRFVREVTPLPAGGRQITAADGSFGRYDAHGDVVATGSPLPGGPAGRNLVTQPPTAAGTGPHGGAWLEDAAGRRLPDWNVTTRPDGRLRVEVSLPGSARRGEFLELAADGTLVRQGFNVLDSGRRTDFQYVVDRATGTWQRTTHAGAPTATGAFHHGAVDLTGAVEGRLRLLGSTGAPVAVFERRVLPGATGDVLDAFRRTDTIAFGRTNPRTTWARWDDSGALRGSGGRHYDTAGTGWRDTDGLGRTVREYRDGLQKFDGRPGHTLAVRDDQGAWTWHRYDGAAHEVASGPRTREGVGGGWTDRTADGRVVQRQWGGVEWPERAGQYQEHALRRDGTLAGTWERHSPHGKEVGKREVMRDGGILTTERWREQRPPAWVRTRWLPGAQQAQPPYAHVRGDNTYQLFTWAKEAPDATTSGVRYVGLDGSTLDLAADGGFVRSTGKLHDGTTLKVGDHARRPGHAPDDLAHQPWEDSGGRLGYRVPQRDAPGGALWQDVYRDSTELRVAREGRPGGVVREYADPAAGNRAWVDRDAHGNLVGQSHANPDGAAHHVVEGRGAADSGRWTWRELDADGAQVATGRREFFRGSSDSRLPWDDSYRDFDAAGHLVRERRMLDSGRYVDAWRDPDPAAGGRWLTSAHERNGTPIAPGAGEQIRNWWNPRTRTWQDQWLPGAGHFRDELRVTPHGPHLTLRETPVGSGGPLRVRSYDTTVTPATPARSVWKEYDHGGVVRQRRAEAGGFLETDAWRGQWNRYTADGDLVARRTDSGLVFERDTFGRWQLAGNEYDFRGPLTEIRGWGRRVREAQRMPWSGTTVPEGPFGLGGNPALREARYQPYWQSVAQKAALEFGQEFLLEFGANLAVNGIVAAAQNKPFTGQDALKSFANAAVGAGIKTGLSTAIHENRGAFFRDLGDYKAGYANIDGGKPWTRRPGNHDKTWANEWAGNETATRWRGGTYDFSFGVLSSVLSGWVNGSMNAAVWGVSNANGDTVKLSGWEALADGGINAAASLTTAVTTGLVKNVFVLSTGGRLFHRQGFADFWVQLPFKLFEKSIQSLYLTSAYRANISPPWYQAP